MTSGSPDPQQEPTADSLPLRYARVAERVAAVQERLVRLQQLAAEQSAAPAPRIPPPEPDPA